MPAVHAVQIPGPAPGPAEQVAPATGGDNGDELVLPPSEELGPAGRDQQPIIIHTCYAMTRFKVYPLLAEAVGWAKAR